MSKEFDGNSREPQMALSVCVICILLLILSLRVHGQATPGTPPPTASTAVPNLVRFNGRATNADGKPLAGDVGITFALYAQQTGGPALWLETQNVQLDSAGRFAVLLGVTKSDGLPTEIFVSGEARWVGVQVAGQSEQPRVMLLPVPYALKAGDAETVGGLPPSAFILAAPPASSAITSAPNSTSTTGTPQAPPAGTVTGSGTVNFIPLWTSTSGIGNSVLFQSGTGSTAKVGINNSTPASTLDVKGGSTIRGLLSLPATGTATAAAGKNSQPLMMAASAFNSSTSKAVPQTFEWQVEPAGNNTTAPVGTLNLLFGSGASKPVETGLNVSSNGQISFAPGQTFPGMGNGTITGVTAGTDLTGGGTSGGVTLNLDTTKVPQLAGNNNFTGNLTVAGNVGIATTAPAFKLDVNSGDAAVRGVGNFTKSGQVANLYVGDTNHDIQAVFGGGLVFSTYLTPKAMTISDAGGLVIVPGAIQAGSLGSPVLGADNSGTNNGASTPGLQFGGSSSGETIASDRNGGPNQFGLDFFTNYTRRVSITNSGRMGIGTGAPLAQLESLSPSSFQDAIIGIGGNALDSSGGSGTNGVSAFGGNGDANSEATFGGSGLDGQGGYGGEGGGSGVFGVGGPGGEFDGYGGEFYGGTGNAGGIGLYVQSGSSAVAADFTGDVIVIGSIDSSGASFKIDHPLDPANKYLQHSAVESPDRMNIYNGNVVTDGSGDAVVQLPDYFEVLNRDFRYQLTVIGQFAQAIVSQELSNGNFSIKTDKPNVKVSWQITGIRQDAWANAHPLPVEATKKDRERGYYLAPEVFGAPEEKGVAWAWRPESMKRMRALRQRNAAAAQRRTVTGSVAAEQSERQK